MTGLQIYDNTDLQACQTFWMKINASKSRLSPIDVAEFWLRNTLIMKYVIKTPEMQHKRIPLKKILEKYIYFQNFINMPISY